MIEMTKRLEDRLTKVTIKNEKLKAENTFLRKQVTEEKVFRETAWLFIEYQKYIKHLIEVHVVLEIVMVLFIIIESFCHI